MTPAEILFACVLSLLDPRGMSVGSCESDTKALDIADAITNATVGTQIPPAIVAADIWHESTFNAKALGPGKNGALGLMQVKRQGAVEGAYAKMSNAQLMNVSLNIYLGVSYMARQQHRCEIHYLTKYNRPATGCKPSTYSQGVLDDLKMGQMLLRKLMTQKLRSNS